MVTIEELAPADFGLVAQWLTRPEINQWLSGEWRSRQATSSLVAIAVRNRHNRLYLVRHEALPCGLVALGEIDTADAIAMVWFFLGDSALSGRGIASQAVKQMVRKCFQELKLESLYAWAMEDNIASINVLQKVGFREAGRLRRAACSGGCRVDRIYFDLVARECP